MRAIKNNRTPQSSGFTLIELLVVISIIGVLASVIYGNLQNARLRARDARRFSDIKAIGLAEEFYFNAHDGYQLDTVGNWEYICTTSPGDTTVLQTEGLLPSIPCDPVNTGNFQYRFDTETCGAASCSQYCVTANLERGGAFHAVGGDYQGCP